MMIFKLKPGDEMPVLGLGTWQAEGDECYESVKKALELGYRHIDTAEMYDNEEEIGRAVADSDVDREDIFITSKLWFSHYKPEDAVKACEESLKKLQTDYLDLYLLHWPEQGTSLKNTIEALNKLVEEGKVRNIGVSNFSNKRFEKAQSYSDVPLACNQVECHPYLQQNKILEFCKEKGVAMTAYSPLARGEVFDNEVLKEVAEKHDVSVAQVALRWQIQRGAIVIPKATTEEHIKDNFAVLDLELDADDMEKINNLNKNKRLIDPGFAKWD